MASEHFQQNLFNMTQYAGVFHAKIYPWQGGAKASRQKPDQVFFTNSCESYAWYDPNTSSWKTWQRSLITDWTSYSGSFPKQGTMQNGQLYLQVHWEPVIKDQGGGSLPTPTAMDTKEDALKHATKLLQGKTHRSSGQPIQVTLSDAVMMEKIKENPQLMEIYQDHQMEERPHLPKQEEFVTYLRSQTTIKELAEKTTIKKTTIEHWFRKDKAGFSYPSIENWQEIKPHLKKIQFDIEMTTIQSKEWTTKSPMLPTPTASDVEGGVAKDVQFQNGSFFRENKQRVRWGVKLRDAVSILPTPTASEHKARITNKTTQAGKCLSAMARRNELSTQTGGNMFLNPAFCEEMMGYEVGWTDLKH